MFFNKAEKWHFSGFTLLELKEIKCHTQKVLGGDNKFATHLSSNIICVPGITTTKVKYSKIGLKVFPRNTTTFPKI